MNLFDDEFDDLFGDDAVPGTSNVGRAKAADDDVATSAPAPVPLRDLADAPTTRTLIFDRTRAAVAGLAPLENQRYRLRLSDVDYMDPDVVPRAELKRAQLHGRTVARRLRGTWTLEDRETGAPVATRRAVVAHVPYYDDRGTFTVNGSHWSLSGQMRLRPGTYTRRRDNGETEVHCLHRSTRVWTEAGMIPIGDIVRNRMNIRVWSYDFEVGEFVLRPVTGWFRNPVKTTMGRARFDAPGRLPTRLGRHHPQAIWATPEHKVFSCDGHKRPIATVDQLVVVEEQLTAAQEQVIYGSLLGDGYVGDNGIYEEIHCLAQEDYIGLKAQILGPLVDGGIKPHQHSGRPYRRFTTKASASLRRARQICYQHGEKRITQEWLDKVDARGLAFWFCDDGSSLRATNSTHETNCLVINLATQGFTTRCIELLQAWLASCWGIQSRKDRQKIYEGKDHGWYLLLTSSDAERFLDLIAPHVHPSMAYKFPDRPAVGECRTCQKSIDRRRKICNRCCLAEFGGDWRRSDTVRCRFGSRAEARRLLLAGPEAVPPDPDPGGQWEARMASLGVGVPAMLDDTTPRLGLAAVPCTYTTGTGMVFERARVAYDIEVDGTHNYVANGVLVSNCNVAPGQGVSQRIHLDPETGIFQLQVGQSKVPLVTLLREQGVTARQLASAWGHRLAHANLAKDDPSAVDKLHARLVREDRPGVPRGRQVAEALAAMPLDPEVTRHTLGTPHDRLTPAVYLDASRKLLAVSRGEQQPDDRDHLAYMTLHGPEDLLPERVGKDQGPLKRAFWKASLDGSLDRLPSGVFTRPIMAAIQSSGLGQPNESINPLMVAEQMYRVTRMGTGGLPGVDSIPMESRAVQPSHLGFVDPVATPENLAAGVDLRLASGVKKGSDGRPYAPFKDARTGRVTYLHPGQLADATIAFPGELESGRKWVRAIDRGRMRYVRREQARYQLPDMEPAFSPLGNLVPMKSAIKGQRLAMGQRMTAQALPLAEPEAPHVQAGVPGSRDESYEQRYGRLAGAVHADADGTVAAVRPDGIDVRGGDGRVRHHDLAAFEPSNRKTFVSHTPVVRPGDPVEAGQLLARSNYTNDRGEVALGKNLRVAMLPGFGPHSNFEDAFIISESAARKLTSDHAYQHELEHEDGLQAGKAAYVSAFPGRFERRLLENFDDDGVIKPGTAVDHGDPLILAVKQREPSRNRVHHGHGQSFVDKSQTWDHHSPGVVTDVARTGDGIKVVVRTQVPMQQGDKLSNRFGAKGLVGSIVPDDEMPHGADGRPIELLYNPAMTVSRINPAAIVEMALGKVAEKTGQPYRVQDFRGIPSLVDFADAELKKHGMTSMEPVVDPRTGRKIPAFVGNGFIMKLHHTSESKIHGRSTGGYTAEGRPAKGTGDTSSKRFALGELHAALSHGATGVIRDALYVRGQANPEFWARWMGGYDPPLPRVPLVHEKFFNLLKAAGIHPVRENRRIHLMALTDRDTDALAGGRALRNADLVDWKDGLKEVPGGLFDPKLTGGHAGTKWASLPLAEPMPNPVVAEPIRRVLGLTEDRFRAVLAGRERLGEATGPRAIAAALDRVDLPKAIEQARDEVKHGRKSRRDDAIKRLGFLRGAQDAGLHPRDWMWSKVPVIPPLFRPVSVMQGTGRPMVADANILYGELHQADRNLRAMAGRVDDLSTERLAVYDALRAVTGLGDPIHPTTVERNVKGALREVLGPTGKYGYAQRKLLSAPVDVVGRSVVIPNPDLDMDEIGLPESTIFEVYRPFIVRRLVRAGMPRLQAVREVAERTDRARRAVREELDARPVIMTRAPVLHRYGVMAFRPRIMAGDAIHTNPFITTGFGMDFDGDQTNIHVPVSDDAVRDALAKMLPSKNLFSAADFGVNAQVPLREYAAGLYLATRDAGGGDGRAPQTYATRKDAAAAARRGAIDYDQPVEVVQH